MNSSDAMVCDSLGAVGGLSGIALLRSACGRSDCSCESVAGLRMLLLVLGDALCWCVRIGLVDDLHLLSYGWMYEARCNVRH